jgi:hypothetical protein
VCENHHWWLIYVDFKSSILHSVDSFYNEHKEGLKLVYELMLGSMFKSPQQFDGVSCGAYVMFVMTLLTFGTYSIMSSNFTPDMIQPFWGYVFNCIMQEEFHELAYACPVCLHWYTSKEGGPEMVACDLCGIWTHLA